MTAKAMSDDERELHIKHCGDLLEECHRQGNTEAALGWMQAMQEAIKSRSPEQVARMEAERGLGEPCYFCDQGDKDRLALLSRQAA